MLIRLQEGCLPVVAATISCPLELTVTTWTWWPVKDDLDIGRKHLSHFINMQDDAPIHDPPSLSVSAMHRKACFPPAKWL